MKIKTADNPTLCQWIKEGKRVKPPDEIEVSDTLYAGLIQECAHCHPKYSPEVQQAWAAYNAWEPEDAEQPAAPIQGTQVVFPVKRLETSLLGIRDSMEEKADVLCGEVNKVANAALDAGGEIAKSTTKLKDSIREMVGIAADYTINAITEHRKAMDANAMQARKAFHWWAVADIALKAIGVVLLGLLMAGAAHAQFEHINIREYNGSVVGAGNPIHVTCTSGCSGGTTDTDDGAIAAGQTIGLSGALNYVYDGAGWVRAPGDSTSGLTVNLGTNNDVTVTGTVTANAGTGTFIVGDGAGALNTIVDSGTLTAVTSITNPVAVTGTFWQATQPVSGTVTANAGSGTFIVGDGAGALNVICDSGCTPGGSFADNAAFTFGTTAINIAGYVLDDAATNAATENSAAAPRMSSNRVAYSQLRDAAGNERGANVTAGNALVVDGSAVTQPVSGTVTVTDGAGALNVIVDSGSITANAGTNLNTSLLALESGGNLATVAGDTTDIEIAVELIDDTVATLGTTTYLEATTKGLFAGAVRRDADTSAVNTDNEAAPLLVNAIGALKVEAFDSGDSFTVDQATASNLNATVVGTGTFAAQVTVAAGAATIAKAEDAAHGDLDVGVPALAIRDDTLNIRSGAENDYEPLHTTATGALWTQPISTSATGAAPPSMGSYAVGLGSGGTGGFLVGMPVCDSFFPVDIVTATTTLAVTGVSGRHVRICSINLVTAAANNVALISGTGATCGTSTAGINGGTTAAEGWNFAANGGIALGNGLGTVMQTETTGDSVCIVTSAAVQLSGTLTYAIY